MRARRLLNALLLVTACTVPRPARFASAPPVTRVADDEPIAIPRRDVPVQEFELTESYVRGPVVMAMDPVRVADASDINAVDEVPRSSWLSPTDSWLAGDDAPPEPPMVVLTSPPDSGGAGIAVVDASGKRFELRRDPSDRPEMRTAASAVASRIFAALGYFTAPSWVLYVQQGDLTVRGDALTIAKATELREDFLQSGPPPEGSRFRVSATRWPIGKDLGPTRAFGVRADDKNDRVRREDRRTLRAFAAIFPWLGITRRSPGLLRDAYIGEGGKGHVVHVIVDVSDALGAGSVVRPAVAMDDDSDLSDRDGWVTLGSLGLYTPKVYPTDRRWPSLGAFEPRLTRSDFIVRLPFEPISRALGSDAYWATKRMAEVPPEVIDQAISAGKLSSFGARARLAEVLGARRVGVVAWAMSSVTACEVEGVTPPQNRAPPQLHLRDESVLRGVFPSGSMAYRVEVLDDQGAVVGVLEQMTPQSALFSIPLPTPLPPPASTYRIVRVTALRATREVRRSLDVHLVSSGATWLVVGVRH